MLVLPGNQASQSVPRQCPYDATRVHVTLVLLTAFTSHKNGYRTHTRGHTRGQLKVILFKV